MRGDLPSLRSHSFLSSSPLSAPGDDGVVPIYAKTLTGKMITLHMTRMSTVAQTKVMIQMQEGIPTDQQRLICGGQQLQDDRALGDYDIQREDIMHLALRLRDNGREQDKGVANGHA